MNGPGLELATGHFSVLGNSAISKKQEIPLPPTIDFCWHAFENSDHKIDSQFVGDTRNHSNGLNASPQPPNFQTLATPAHDLSHPSKG